MSLRSRPIRGLMVGVITALALLAFAAGANAAPSVSAFAASPTTLASSGGVVTLSATVGDAATCRFASTPAVTGLPVTVPCTAGPVSLDVTLPANTNTAARVYTFRLTVARPGAGNVQATPVLVTVEPTPAPSVQSFTASPTQLPPTGGNVDLAASVSNAATCRFTASPAVTGLPLTLPCDTGSAAMQVTLPANTGGSARTYTFRLAVSRPGAGGAVQATPALVTVEPTPPPTVYSFTAFPTLLPPSGGNVDLAASVGYSATCRFSSTPAVAGLPLTVPCDAGWAATAITLPANASGNPRTYTLRMTAARPGAGSSQATTTVVVASAASPAADLSVAGSDAPDPVTVEQPLDYTFTVVNNGPDPAASVTFTGSLPGGASFVSATPSQGSPCTEASGTVTCALGAIANGATATVSITVVPTSSGGASSTGTATSTANDFQPNDNSASVFTSVREPRIVYGDDQTGQIWSMDYPNGAGNVALTSQPGAKSDPVISPDRSTIAYWRQAPGTFASELWLVDADGTDERFVYEIGVSMVPRASWSADSSKIVFSALVSGAWKAVVASADGPPDPQLLIPDMTYGEEAPAYSPDGASILFKDSCLRPVPAQCKYHRVNADGSGTPVAYETYPQGFRGIVWDPDGEWFYFQSGWETIYRARVDGTLAEPVINAQVDPRWSISPQGDRIAYSERVEGKQVVSIVNTDGSNRRQLTTGFAAADPAGCYSPVWSRLQDYVVMHCYPGSGAIGVYRVNANVSSPVAPTNMGGGFRSREPALAGTRPTN